MEGILIPITLFLLSAIVLWKFYDGLHRERMALIQANMINENLKYLYRRAEAGSNRYSALKWGLVALGVGAGFFLSVTLAPLYNYYNEDQLTAGCIISLGGLGFVLYYFIVSIMQRKEKQAAPPAPPLS